MKPFLSVIIPTYNEVDRLPLTLIDVDRHLSNGDLSYEVLVTDDGSTDGTYALVEHFARLMPNLRIIRAGSTNQGKGFAVRRGMEEARGNIRLFMDADNATSVDQCFQMVPFFKEGYDVIIGSRSAKGSVLMPPQPLLKQIAGLAGSIFVRLLGLQKRKDTQCGFKCFSEEAAQEIFRRTKIQGWIFDTEVLMLADRLGFRTKEVPVVWKDNHVSKVSMRGYYRALFDALRIRWWLSRKQYDLPS